MTSPTTTTTAHRWNFMRVGGLDQVRFTSGADLAALDTLDQKLWVALSCPSRGLEFDTKTLGLIDTDGDGRIRAPELIAAIKWATARLKSPESLINNGSGLPLDAIDDSTADGKVLLRAARQILMNLGTKDAAVVTVADTSDTAKIFGQTQFNGDGVVPPESAHDETIKLVIADMMKCIGSVQDRSGLPGVNTASVDTFYTELAGYSAWWAAGEAHSKAGSGVLPLGAETPKGFAAFKAVKAKIDDFFARCRLAAFDARAAAHLNRPESEYAAIAEKDLSTLAPEIAAMPLARIEAGFPLPLVTGLNPAWAGAVKEFTSLVVLPLLGEMTALTAADWNDIRAKFAAYESWEASKQGARVESLGLERIRTLLADESRAGVMSLIAEDMLLAEEASGIDNVNRLALYHRDLFRLVNNYVSFTDFYSPDRLAIFQSGTLYLDSRSCELCVQVADPAAHAILGGLGKCYIAYCACKRTGGESMNIAAVFSNGDSDYLMVGRNGVFYDRKGRDWDATIVKVVENPISIRQAFFSPYKKFIRMIEEQVAKRAAAADAASSAKLAGAAETAANVDKSAPAAPKKMDIGSVAAIGIAFGAIGTFLGTIFAALMGLGPWLPFGLLGLMLLISLPSMVIAWIKLRQRTLGPVLEANGWAINGRVKINIPLGTQLTELAKLPPGSKRSLDDPYEDKEAKSRRRLIILVVLMLITAVVAIRVHAVYLNDGLYFWQDPPPVVEPVAPAAPATLETAPVVTPPAPTGG
ncbi:MAG TPA: hypothetical protein VMM36_06050 [Opitutaceae bacterium]|nr:hypothetical protein [Opitutaceae bacterium]